jgi:hypothetical protein
MALPQRIKKKYVLKQIKISLIFLGDVLMQIFQHYDFIYDEEDEIIYLFSMWICVVCSRSYECYYVL